MQGKGAQTDRGNMACSLPDDALRYLALANEIERRIMDGRFKPLRRIPSENKLAQMFGVSRVTVRSALRILERKNLVERKAGVGTFPNLRRLHHDLGIVENLFGQLATRGIPTEMKLRRYHWASVDEGTAEMLGFREAMRLSRIFYVDRAPFAVTESYLNPVAKSISYADIERDQGYVLLESLGHHIARANLKIRSERPTRDVVDVLGIPRSDSVLVLERTSYSDSGVPLEYTRCFIRSDAIEFEVNVSGESPLSARFQSISTIRTDKKRHMRRRR